MKESLHQPYFCRTSKGGQERIGLGAVRLEIHHLLLFVSIVFQVHCLGDLMLCWELTRVVEHNCLSKLYKIATWVFSFPSQAMHIHLEWKVVTKEPADKRFVSFRVDLCILSPRSWRWENSYFYLFILIILIKYNQCTQNLSASCFKENTVLSSL